MSDNTMHFQQMEPVIREVLDADGEITLQAAGTSMEPFLRDQRDSVTLRRPARPLQKGDVPFYKRRNGQFILHRVVGKDTDGYILRGDNQWVTEHGVQESDVIAVLTKIEKNGRQHEMDGLYCRSYYRALPVIRWGRRLCRAIRNRLR